MCSGIYKTQTAPILKRIYMPTDKCHHFSEDSCMVFDDNNSHRDKEINNKKNFWMTIIKIYNQINKQPFEDVQAEVERLMKEPPHMFQNPRRSHAYRWARLFVVDPPPPPPRDATCPWYLTQHALALCFELFTI